MLSHILVNPYLPPEEPQLKIKTIENEIKNFCDSIF